MAGEPVWVTPGSSASAHAKIVPQNTAAKLPEGDGA